MQIKKKQNPIIKESKITFLKRYPQKHKLEDYLIGGKGSVEYMPYFILTYGIDKFAKEVNKLKYRDFLKTKYWQNVRILKRRSLNHPHMGKCEICGNTNKPQRNKNTHHLTYEHKGYEWLYLDDLMELCIICHRIIHNKQKSNLNVDLVLQYMAKREIINRK